MLINCVAYQEGNKLADIHPGEISDYVNRPECFVWVALYEPSNEELQTMQAEFNLHELAVEDARHGHQRPKIEEYGDSLFAVLHIVEVLGGELYVGEVDVFVGRNYILSVRSRTQQGLLGVRDRSEREPELLRLGAGYVLYAITPLRTRWWIATSLCWMRWKSSWSRSKPESSPARTIARSSNRFTP